MVTNKVQDVFAFNFFRHAFGVELTAEDMPKLKEIQSRDFGRFECKEE